MNSAYVYLQLYRQFDRSTPVPVDCGQLCSAACCAGDDSGMLLFPGEEEVYKLLTPEGFRIEKSDLEYEDDGIVRKTPILFCDGMCDRFVRPLACRIFPLTPVLNENGRIDIIVDPRAKSICPLAKTMRVEEYESGFVRAIRRSFLLLSKNRHVRAFLKEYTDYINEFRRFF